MLKKIDRKMNRCLKIAQKQQNLELSDVPTNTILIGNGGLVCGIDNLALLELFSPFGPVTDIISLPDKSYSFVIFENIEHSTNAMVLNGQDVLGQDKRTIYLGFVKNGSSIGPKMDKYTELPAGAILVLDFVTANEENNILKSVENSAQNSLKNRAVWHYGYEFDYNTNKVDPDAPLQRKIPSECDSVLRRCSESSLIQLHPDQLTVNRYEPGQGIPLHIDTHSIFEDSIICLNLGSHISMDFRHGDEDRSVYLPQRSLLIMAGESRYSWQHGIKNRKTDLVSEDGKLVLKQRGIRTSLTFRKVRFEGGCQCNYPIHCDSQQNMDQNASEMNQNVPKKPITEAEAKCLEQKHVYEVYNSIADHFSETRYKPWPRVSQFLDSLSSGSLLLDVGCGNGKYLGRSKKLIEIGSDMSSGLLEICVDRGIEVAKANALNLPFRTEKFDACLCIAMLHHLATEERRLAALNEIARVLKAGGSGLIYVWALEQQDPGGATSNYINPNRAVKRNNEGLIGVGVNETTCQLPVHVNRTPFEQQDLLVPWKNAAEGGAVEHRFYHVFEKGELEVLVRRNEGVQVEETFYDKGNWCLIFKKKCL